MNNRPFVASHYQGKPAVYDMDTRVVYTGFPTMRAARERAETLNNPDTNQDQDQGAKHE